MDEFAKVYYLLWSVLAIGGGILVLFFRKDFLKRNARALHQLSEKTTSPFLELQAKKMESVYMQVVITVVAIIFVVAGLFLLSQNI